MQRSFVLVACAAVLTGCVTAKVERDSQLAPEPAWEATLTPGAGHTLRGRVTVLPLPGGGGGIASRSRVTVSIEGAAPGASYAWHVHRGTCGSDGPIVGPASNYVPVPVGGGGAAQLIAEIPIRLSRGGAYFAHVHDAVGSNVAACGALQQGGTQVLARR